MAGKIRPDRVAVGLVVLLGVLTLWNTLAYPAGAGYDAHSHWEYADFLIDHHRLPHRNETPEYYSPPAYFAVAGAATWVGRQVGLGEPHKLGQLLNVPLAIGTALCVLGLARLLWPRRPWLGVAAVAYLALCPLLLKVSSMFHPEPSDLFVSALALYLAARVLVRGLSWPSGIGLGIVLGIGELVRQFSLWTLAVVVLAFLAAAVRDRRVLRPLAAALAVTAAISLPWYVYRAVHYRNAIFDRPHVQKPLFERRPASFYLGTGLPYVFTAPYRPHYVNRVWPTTYSDLWGDWYGTWSWDRADSPKPSRAQDVWLGFQDVLGILPTVLAIGGWLALLFVALRRLDAPLLLPALLPLAGLAGYFYFVISYPTRDGDVLKPMYMLTTAPGWAIAFGWAAERLGARRPRVVVPVLVALGLLALPFLPYKGALGLG